MPSPGRKIHMGEPVRVLIVEDSVNDAELMIGVIRRAGHCVTYDVVGSPNRLQQRLEDDYDVILCDHNRSVIGCVHQHEKRTRGVK